MTLMIAVWKIYKFFENKQSLTIVEISSSRHYTIRFNTEEPRNTENPRKRQRVYTDISIRRDANKFPVEQRTR